jgi:hypothetical protein
MFSMIITIIAIALVAALALATLYYGTGYYKDGQARAAAAKTIQQGNQIIGALELYKVDQGSLPTGTSDEIKQSLLDNKYLAAWPETAWQMRDDYVVRSDLDATACQMVNQSLKIATIPTCDDPAYAGKSYCCQTN